MTDTDLISVDDSATGTANHTAAPVEPSDSTAGQQPVSSRAPESAKSSGGESAAGGEVANGSLAAMVLPELRALAS